MNNINLIPNVSVGHIKFGETINSFLKYEHTYFKKEKNDIYMEDFYEFVNPPLIVFVNQDNIITTINCKDQCYWKNQNLIGLTINNLIDLAGVPPDSHEKLYVLAAGEKAQKQDVYVFEDLGMQIWAWKNIIVTVSCTNYDLV